MESDSQFTGDEKTNNVPVPCQKNFIRLLGGKFQVSVSNNLYWGHSREHTVAWCMNLLLQCWGPLLSQILHWIRDSLYADTRGVSVSLDTLRSYSHPRVHSPGMPRNHLLRPETSDGCPWLRRRRRCKKNAGQNSSL